jgi:hypothetical protein
VRFTIAPDAQRSPAWFAARCGLATGSRAAAVKARVRFGEALTRRAYRRQLVYERFTATPAAGGYVSAAMRRGFEQEPAALRAYEQATGLGVDRSGFLTSTRALAGCSLDGSVDRFTGIVEVKNPNSLTHVGWKQAGRLPPAHVAQVTHNLWVTGAQWCDFVSFDDRCGPSWRLFVVRVDAEELDLAAYDRTVRAFLAEVAAELATVTALLRPR